MSAFLDFRLMITPIIIKVLFWVGVVIVVIAGIVEVIAGIAAPAGGGAIVFSGLVTIILGPVVVRIYCELLIVIFRILDELTMIRKGHGFEPHTTPGFPVGTPPSTMSTMP